MSKCVFACFSLVNNKLLRRMSVFTQKLNPLAGKIEWEVQDENYDYHQEIARSSFADMLHDSERNQKYYRAINEAIKEMHAQNKKANVLDIGTGTGLLSMMAVKCGADSVTACETFIPVAKCAREIIKANGFAKQIKLISKNSLDLKVGTIGDMKQRANILVTEVFDTELIGEGAITIFDHAHRELLENDCIVVPSSATIYAQVVESPLAFNWRKIQSILDTETGKPIITIPQSIQNCVGSPAVHDIQLSQFPITHFNTILSPTPVFRFDWSGKTEFIKQRTNTVAMDAEKTGVAQVVFMWWDLTMDSAGKIRLSCAPFWAHPDGKSSDKDSIPWRDHWMQAVYFLPEELHVPKGDQLSLIANHDEYSLWFNVKNTTLNVTSDLNLKTTTTLNVTSADYQKPLCQCGLHFVFSRTRIGQMNDSTRNKKYLAALRDKISPETICLCLSEGSLLSLMAAKMGAKKVYCVTNMHMTQVALDEIAAHNRIKDRLVFIEDIDEIREKKINISDVNLVIGEPFFSGSLLPWDNLHFMIVLKNDLGNVLPADYQIFPIKATLNLMPTQFRHLHKIKASLKSTEGFNMTIFDDLIKRSMDKADAKVEPQPLWEYTSNALSLPEQIMEFDIVGYDPKKSRNVSGEIVFDEPGTLNGITLWLDWYLDANRKNRITTGPVIPPQIGAEIKWDMYTRQGVYLLREPIDVKSNDILQYQIDFNSIEFKFEFRLNGKVI